MRVGGGGRGGEGGHCSAGQMRSAPIRNSAVFIKGLFLLFFECMNVCLKTVNKKIVGEKKRPAWSRQAAPCAAITSNSSDASRAAAFLTDSSVSPLSPSAGRHGKGGTFPRQFQLPNRSKDYGDRKEAARRHTRNFHTFSSVASSHSCHLFIYFIFSSRRFREAAPTAF